jgi:hypothetical protein
VFPGSRRTLPMPNMMMLRTTEQQGNRVKE